VPVVNTGFIFLRGGGDLASGVALRLHRAGLRVVIAELAEPLVVRRLAAFGQAMFEGVTQVEGVIARRAADPQQALNILTHDEIPVLADPGAETRVFFAPAALVDGRMNKRPSELGLEAASLVIGLGPGFSAGLDCHAVIETQRGHRMGRVIWQGAAQADTGTPEMIGGHSEGRVLRAPADGRLETFVSIGDHLESGQAVAQVDGQAVHSPLRGVLRGLLYPGLSVLRDMKIGDVDPRDDPSYCRLVSDKALAVGGGVLEALLTWPDVRQLLWDY
jgi:xanthine dehydrogenase accessory factor